MTDVVSPDLIRELVAGSIIIIIAKALPPPKAPSIDHDTVALKASLGAEVEVPVAD